MKLRRLSKWAPAILACLVHAGGPALAEEGAPGSEASPTLPASTEDAVDVPTPRLTFLGYSADSPPVALRHGVEAYRAGNFYLAYVLLGDALAADDPPPGLRPDAWFYLGLTCLEVGMPEGALPNFWKVVEAGRGPHNPFYDWSLLEIARVNYRWGEYGAVAELYANHGVDPQSPQEYLYLLGMSLLGLQKYQAGADLLDALAFAGPYYPFGQFALAQVHIAQDDADAALDRLENAIRAPGPTGGSLLVRERARLVKGFVLYGAKRYDEAIDAFYELGPRSPEFWGGRLGIAWCYIKLEDFPLAIAYLEEIVAARPADHAYSAALADMGRAFAEVQLFDRSIRSFKKSLYVVEERIRSLREMRATEAVTTALVKDLVAYRIAADPYLRAQETEVLGEPGAYDDRITNLVDSTRINVLRQEPRRVLRVRYPSIASLFLQSEPAELPEAEEIEFTPKSPYFALAHEVYADDRVVSSLVELAAASVLVELRVAALEAELERTGATIATPRDRRSDLGGRVVDALYRVYDWELRLWNVVDGAELRKHNEIEGHREDALRSALGASAAMALLGMDESAAIRKFETAKSLVRYMPIALERREPMVRKVESRRAAAAAQQLGVDRSRAQMLSASRDPNLLSRPLMLSTLADHQRLVLRLYETVAEPLFVQRDLEQAIATNPGGWDPLPTIRAWRARIREGRAEAYRLIGERMGATIEREVSRYTVEAADAEMQIARASLLKKDQALKLIQERSRRESDAPEGAPGPPGAAGRTSPNPNLIYEKPGAGPKPDGGATATAEEAVPETEAAEAAPAPPAQGEAP